MNATHPALDLAHPALAEHAAEVRRLGRFGALVLALCALPAAAWLGLAPLSSAVIAPAVVKVDLDRRPVQHVEGGTVREVRVRDGQQVKAGQALLVLGDVAVDADVNRLTLRVLSERASLARLEAEQGEGSQLGFPPDVLAAAQADERVAAQLDKERALFEARRDTLLSQLRLLKAQREKVAQEVASLRAQIDRAGESLGHQRSELESHRRLLQDGYISQARVSQLQATVADYGVKYEERRSELARAEQRLLDLELKGRALQSEYRQEASDQLKVTAARLSELQQELRKFSDAAARQVIAAPIDGQVLNLKVTSPGAVVSPREVVADIVPFNPKLVIEARLRTDDVSRVAQGLPAQVRLAGINQRTTRLVEGRLVYVAPDRSVDRATNEAYYIATVEAEAEALRAAGEVRLHAGMPAEVFIQGERRTPLDYLLEPITDLTRRGLRER